MDTLLMTTLGAGVFFGATVLWRTQRTITISPAWRLQALAVVALLALTTNVRQRSIEDVDNISVDGQVAVRLAVYGLLIVYALTRRGIWTAMASRTGIYATLLVGVALISCVWSLDPRYSLVSSMTWLSMLLFGSVLLTRLTALQTGAIIAWYGVIVAAASVAIAVINPAMGLRLDYGDTVPRLQGIGTHPNGLGVMMALGVGAALYMLRHSVWRGTWGFLGLLLMTTALLATQSRTAIAAAGLAYLLAFARQRWWTWILVALGGVAVAAYGDTELLSRTDGADLNNLNGRTAIWDYALQSWYASPVFGVGQAASRVVMVDFPNPNFVTTHPHSMYLNLLVTLGLLGAIPFALYVTQLFRWLRERDEFSVFAVVLVLLHGLTETGVLGAYASTLFLVLFLASRRAPR